MAYNKKLYKSNDSVIDSSVIYDDTQKKLQSEINAEVGTDISDLNGSLNTYARPNLLDNWYFVGGGSQSGNGVFPINQRGQTSYSAAGYGIDRWKRTTAASGNILVNANGLTSSSAALFVRQANDIHPQLIGKTLTYSILWRNAGLKSVTHVFEADHRFTTNNSTPTQPIYASGGISLPNELVAFPAIPDDYVIAIKLEVGDTQTLAHLENGVWVLNELPDFQTELRKCLGYYYKTSNDTACMGSGTITGSAKRVIMNVTVPVPLIREISSVKINNGYVLRLGSGGYSALTPNETYTAPESLQYHRASKYATSIRIEDVRSTSTGDTNNTACTYAARGIEISCEP